MNHLENVEGNRKENTLPKQKHVVTGEELFSRYLSGNDEYAFEELVALYEGDLSRFINSKINDSYEAKHLTIEAFGQLAVNGKKYKGQASLKTYLFTIARNLIAKHLKTQSKHDYISYDELVYDLSDATQTPDIHFEREETRKLLHEVMTDLKEDYLKILKLLYFEDMSYRQAGEILGKSEKQIKDLAYRARASLKKKLEERSF